MILEYFLLAKLIAFLSATRFPQAKNMTQTRWLSSIFGVALGSMQENLHEIINTKKKDEPRKIINPIRRKKARKVNKVKKPTKMMKSKKKKKRRNVFTKPVTNKTSSFKKMTRWRGSNANPKNNSN